MRRISRKEAGGFLVIMAAAVISASPSADGPPPQRHELVVQGLEFRSPRLRVRPGDTVVWINRDAVPHTVSAREGTWDSGELQATRSFVWVAARSGSVEYYCRYHPLMEGTIEVADR